MWDAGRGGGALWKGNRGVPVAHMLEGAKRESYDNSHHQYVQGRHQIGYSEELEQYVHPLEFLEEEELPEEYRPGFAFGVDELY